MTRRAFTLIELLLAAVLASILMAGLIVVLSGVARDARRVQLHREQPRTRPLLELLRRDFTNATSVTTHADGFTLTGNAAIDPESGLANGRLARVTYRTNAPRSTPTLVREQTYLDDPLHPTPWTDLVSVGVTRIALPVPDRPRSPNRVDEETVEPILQEIPIPARSTVRIEYSDQAIDLSLRLR